MTSTIGAPRGTDDVRPGRDAVEAILATENGKVDRRINFDPEVFELEQTGIFARTWQYAAHQSEVPEPGGFKAVDIAGQSVIVCRDKDGAIHAFPNACSHRGAVLAASDKGNCGSLFRCMYHGWTFDLRGRCVAVPHQDAYGPGFDRHQFDLPRYRAESCAGLVFVSLDPEVAPLTEFLGPLVEVIDELYGDLEVIGRIRTEATGNWKAWHENFTDGYHPELTHNLVHDMGADHTKGINRDLGNGHSMLTWFIDRPDFGSYNARLGAVTGFEHHAEESPGWGFPPFPPKDWTRVYTVFPNLDLQIVSLTMAELEIAVPVAPERTIVESVFFGAPDDTDEQRRWRLERGAADMGSSGKIAADDLEAMARCARGGHARAVPLSDISRGLPHKETARDETGARAFYTEWRRFMLAEVERVRQEDQ